MGHAFAVGKTGLEKLDEGQDFASVSKGLGVTLLDHACTKPYVVE